MSLVGARIRDEQVASDADRDRDLRCSAAGCPNRWSIDMGNGKLCRFHDRADPRDWPRVSEEQQHALTEAAMRRSQQMAAPSPRLSPPERRAIAARLQQALARMQQPREESPFAWAHELQAHIDAGLVVPTPVQREMVAETLACQRRSGRTQP